MSFFKSISYTTVCQYRGCSDSRVLGIGVRHCVEDDLCLVDVCEKEASDLGLGSAFHQVLWFPLPFTTG